MTFSENGREKADLATREWVIVWLQRSMSAEEFTALCLLHFCLHVWSNWNSLNAGSYLLKPDTELLIYEEFRRLEYKLLKT